MSRTDPSDEKLPGHAAQKGRDPGSVGRPLPGIGVKVEDGQLFLKFDSEPRDEWIEGPRDVEIDEAGFLFIHDADTV
jgi:hypothetical protein